MSYTQHELHSAWVTLSMSYTQHELHSAWVTLSMSDTQHKQQWKYNNALSLCWGPGFVYNYAECHYAKCRCAECCYAECRGAIHKLSYDHLKFKVSLEVPYLDRQRPKHYDHLFCWKINNLCINPFPVIMPVKVVIHKISYELLQFFLQ